MKISCAQIVLTFAVIDMNLSLPNWVSPEEFESLTRSSADATTTSGEFIKNLIGVRSGSLCNLNEQCVFISRCKNICTKVKQGLLQTDNTFQKQLKDIFCGGFGGFGNVKVCCAKDSVFEEVQCPELDEDVNNNKDMSTCGEKFSRTSFITGGDDTNPGEWPWMARLLYNDPEEVSGRLTHCGGTLISRRHIVTAAHCIQDDTKPVSVVLGDSDVTTDYDCLDVKSGLGCSTKGATCFAEEVCAPKHVEVKIKDIKIHDKYKYEKCRTCNILPIFDVALLVLEKPVDFTDFIQPVCLPKLNEQSQGPLTITGWGNTIAGSILKGKSSSILQELNVEEVALSKCQTIWKQGLNIDIISSHMCVSTGVTGSASCKGDSGGPLVRETNLKQIFYLVGVVSFGISTCGNVDFPLGFTRVEGEINSWLQEQVGKELPMHPK